uniref:gamma-glutamyl-gamma-aminobutyrate hydrolase family protein n=1 Tax=Rhodococcus qingshengii TaxID=334542 RepID=UPI001C4E2972|nr:gamma-glutamyl-gamma-aminobutyrate hydrolase family protein [Rhodococcus qingshengii]
MTRTTVAPIIGISTRRWSATRVPSLDERYQVREFDFGFADFSRCVAEAGGVPVTIPADADPQSLMRRLDGLVLTGGEDISPARWGGDPADVIGETSPQRDSYDIALLNVALALRLPVLGVCRGMQVINVASGGSLIGDLVRDGREHRNLGKPVDDLAHSVNFETGTLAHSLYGPTALVNSLHHQACLRLGENLVVSGRADDGVIEAIELPGSPVLGVQWHPEWLPTSDPAFGWLVQTARDRLSAAETHSVGVV